MLTDEEIKRRRVEYNRKYYQTHKDTLSIKNKIYRTTMPPEKYERWREQIRQAYYRRKVEKQK